MELFSPKEPVEITVGRHTASVYPRLMPGSPDFECAHAFHCTKAALSLLPITPAQYLDTMGNRLNVSLTVDGFKYDWLQFLEEK